MYGRTRPVAITATLLAVALSGCLGGTATPGDGGSGAVGTTAACAGDETTPRLGTSGALPASAGGFELAANESVVERGQPIAFELTNVADAERSTGTRHRYALQRLVGGQWRTVTLFPAGRSGFNATALPHDPGTGFEWTFRASAAGFSAGKFVVCDRLPAGQYRFVYDGPPALAVRFELVDGGGDPGTDSEHAR